MYSPLWGSRPRCLGHHKHLDLGLCHGRRSEELREALVAALDKKTLWNEYGIVSSIIVSTRSRSQRWRTHLRLAQPYTNDLPRADIHELLSGDLLHQVIKPFKDHIVDWINDWIVLEYGEAGASVIIGEIDRR